MLKGWIIRTAVGLAVLTGVALGQVTTPSKPPLSFDVASIKPVGPFGRSDLSSAMYPGMSIDKIRVSIGSMSLMELICQAYDVSRNRVVGGPAWFARQDAERFGVVANLPDGATRKQVPEMLQSLLATRFQLVAHREKKDTPVYALVVSKSGPKLEEAAPDPPAPASAGEGSETTQVNRSASRTAEGMAFDSAGLRREVKNSGQIRFVYNSLTMERFASLLCGNLDRPVVDQTQLKGKYRVSYEIDLKAIAMARINSDLMDVMDAGKPGVNPAERDDPPLPDPGEAISSSVKKLGLKLDSRVLPCEVLVIDHVERTPTEN